MDWILDVKVPGMDAYFTYFDCSYRATTYIAYVLTPAVETYLHPIPLDPITQPNQLASLRRGVCPSSIA